MRRLTRIPILATLVVLALALVACTSGGTSTGELTSDESPVPEGMPVMYEFYTLS